MSDAQLLALTLALVLGGIVALGTGWAIAREEIKEYTALRRRLIRLFSRGMANFTKPEPAEDDAEPDDVVVGQEMRLSGVVEYVRALPSPADAAAHRSRAAACFVTAAVAFLLAAALAGVDRVAEAVDDCPASTTTSTTSSTTTTTTTAPGPTVTASGSPSSGGGGPPITGPLPSPGGSGPTGQTTTTVC